MTPVAANRAEYLQAAALWGTVVDATAKARWGDLGRESSLLSPLDEDADAADELERQRAFLSEPHVRERLDTDVGVLGYRGRCVRVRANTAGYGGAGALVFVLGPAGEGQGEREAGIATVEVLRRLAG